MMKRARYGKRNEQLDGSADQLGMRICEWDRSAVLPCWESENTFSQDFFNDEDVP